MNGIDFCPCLMNSVDIVANFVACQIKKDLKFYSFDVVNKGDKPHVQVKHKRKKVTFAPEEISAMILGEMKKTAEVLAIGNQVGAKRDV